MGDGLATSNFLLYLDLILKLGFTPLPVHAEY